MTDPTPTGVIDAALAIQALDYIASHNDDPATRADAAYGRRALEAQLAETARLQAVIDRLEFALKAADVDYAESLVENRQASAEGVREILVEGLRDVAWSCTRVWEAWSFGTMTEDDFAPTWENDELIDSLVNDLIQVAPGSALEAVKADTTTEEAEAVARLTHIIAGWDWENPEDGTEEDVKYIHLEATAYVEAARLVRSGWSATDAARQAADLIPRGGPVETEGENRG